MTRPTIVVHCKRSAFDVYIGRPSKWGNPFSHKADTKALFVVPTVADAISHYEEWVKKQLNLMTALRELKGRILGCWCKPGP